MRRPLSSKLLNSQEIDAALEELSQAKERLIDRLAALLDSAMLELCRQNNWCYLDGRFASRAACGEHDAYAELIGFYREEECPEWDELVCRYEEITDQAFPVLYDHHQG